LTNGAIDPNKLVPTMLVECLPQWFLAIILLLVLSASMSTLCSLALVSSAAVGVDLVKGFIAPNASEKTHLTIFRVCCAAFILASYFIALFNPSWIVALMSLSWGAVAGAFLAPYMYGLYWRRTTKAGAIAGMVAGTYWILMLVGRTVGAFIGGKISSRVLMTFTTFCAICLIIVGTQVTGIEACGRHGVRIDNVGLITE
jgi:Na+/proline symporter